MYVQGLNITQALLFYTHGNSINQHVLSEPTMCQLVSYKLIYYTEQRCYAGFFYTPFSVQMHKEHLQTRKMQNA